MSHECPDCGQWCYCDGEDSVSRTQAWINKNCAHECDDETDDDVEIHDEGCERCGRITCACVECDGCGHLAGSLCIDDTCRRGPCCCDCGGMKRERPAKERK